MSSYHTDHHNLPGATLDTPLGPGEGPKANGSVLLFCADTEAEVMKAIREDIYTSSGVWDMTKVEIIPVSMAVVQATVSDED